VSNPQTTPAKRIKPITLIIAHNHHGQAFLTP
jgi:hypothetical protein